MVCGKREVRTRIIILFSHRKIRTWIYPLSMGVRRISTSGMLTEKYQMPIFVLVQTPVALVDLAVRNFQLFSPKLA